MTKESESEELVSPSSLALLVNTMYTFIFFWLCLLWTLILCNLVQAQCFISVKLNTNCLCLHLVLFFPFEKLFTWSLKNFS